MILRALKGALKLVFGSKVRGLLMLGALAGLSAGAVAIYCMGRADAAADCQQEARQAELKSLRLFGGIRDENAKIRARHSGVDDTLKRLRSGTF